MAQTRILNLQVFLVILVRFHSPLPHFGCFHSFSSGESIDLKCKSNSGYPMTRHEQAHQSPLDGWAREDEEGKKVTSALGGRQNI